ncbi:MAG: rRNA pseudouridine synthase [Epsilonproteobacteria bacterium]|uniref:RNA pseudouridylate synthase n=1 Tax=Sulfurospirillum cavolei TaxID=366522 RepID=A0A2D3WBN2_9BACT|nr:rRNA pseudouridine synthase [Campylobacterota bacterium]DAB36490.1 MAG TPA: pseudouridine synthase [Sulfurospirillum cavolei]
MELMRLNKMISHNTHYSRREADQLIKDGLVKVDGKVVDDLSMQVSFKNKIEIKGNTLFEKHGYSVIVYHKPKGELVSKKDDRGRKTVYDSLPSKFGHYLSVGRLDFASEGLLLLCDSPTVVSALMHGDLERVYYVKINGAITLAMEKAMQEGLKLDDARKGGHAKSEIHSMEFAPFLAYRIIKNSPTFSTLKVTINEGKNRELRRFFGYFDVDVVDLKRVSYGKVDLGTLKPGKHRFFNASEYNALRDYLEYVKQDTKGDDQ